MEKTIKYLRISYWSGAIADFILSVVVLFPERMGLTKIELPMGLLSAIIFSWGVLLLFADKKPLERKWVLVPTIIVITLLTITRMIFSLIGKIDFSLGYVILGICLVLLISYSYSLANKIKVYN